MPLFGVYIFLSCEFVSFSLIDYEFVVQSEHSEKFPTNPKPIAQSRSTNYSSVYLYIKTESVHVLNISMDHFFIWIACNESSHSKKTEFLLSLSDKLKSEKQFINKHRTTKGESIQKAQTASTAESKSWKWEIARVSPCVKSVFSLFCIIIFFTVTLSTCILDTWFHVHVRHLRVRQKTSHDSS